MLARSYVDEDAIEPLWKGRRFPMSACISGWTMLNRQAAIVPDIYCDPRIPIDAYRPTVVKSLVMVPIRTHQPIGAIGNYWAQPHKGTEAELRLQALAHSTSVALENVELVSGLERRVEERTAELHAANQKLAAQNSALIELQQQKEALSALLVHDIRSPAASVVRVSARTTPAAVEIQVADDGPGIPTEMRERVFEKYVRLGGSGSADIGRGLGLSFCRLAVEAHRGRIWAEENEPRGTRFRISLPRTAQA